MNAPLVASLDAQQMLAVDHIYDYGVPHEPTHHAD
jgi:hypothetical protein